jgi:ParB-like chromosome segregation protein Spo0J
MTTPGQFRTVKLADIRVGQRHRKDLGDIAALIKSIEAVGLLQPPVVTAELQLIAGGRRLQALRELGRQEADVYVAAGLDDALDRLRAEREENTCRKELTPSEAVAFAEALEALEKEQARQRQTAGVNQHTEASGKLPEGSRGQTRDKVGAALGMSGRTYEKAKAVVEAAAEDPEGCGPLVEEMDRTGKVDPAFKKARASRPGQKKGKGRRERPWFRPTGIAASLERLGEHDATLRDAIEEVVPRLRRAEQNELARGGPDAVRQKALELRWEGKPQRLLQTVRDYGSDSERRAWNLGAPVSDEVRGQALGLLQEVHKTVGDWIRKLEQLRANHLDGAAPAAEG